MTDDESLLEAVAQAIAPEVGLDTESCYEAAIAALRAIDASGTHCVVPRVPTEMMLAAGTSADWVGECEDRAGWSILPLPADDPERALWEQVYRDIEEPPPLRFTSPGIWPAMLDACLAERRGEGT